MKVALILLCFLAVVTVGNCGEEKKLIAEQQHITAETEASRAAAEKSANAWELEVQKLNDEVLPKDHFSHEVKKATKAISAHQAHRAKVIAKANSLHVDKVQAAFRQKKLDQYNKHRAQHNAAEGRVNSKVTTNHVFHENAAEMYARRKAEVEAAFPASWSKQTVLKKVSSAKNKVPNKVWADHEAYRSHQLKKYQNDRMHAKIVKSEMETQMEHAKSAAEAKKELDHLSQISEQVWPANDDIKPKSAVNHGAKGVKHSSAGKRGIAAPHAPQQKPHDWRSPATVLVKGNKKSMPDSSDVEVPSAGTDVAYLGAHQAGYARKPTAHSTQNNDKMAHGSKPNSQRDIKAEHLVHRHLSSAAQHEVHLPAHKIRAPNHLEEYTFSPTFAVKMQRATKHARMMSSARSMPTSSDEPVPEMGTNVVFQGASASGATGKADLSVHST